MIKKNKIVDLGLHSGNLWLAYDTNSYISYVDSIRLVSSGIYRIPEEKDYIELYNSTYYRCNFKNNIISMKSKYTGNIIYFKLGKYLTDSLIVNRLVMCSFEVNKLSTCRAARNIINDKLKLRLIKNDNSN